MKEKYKFLLLFWVLDQFSWVNFSNLSQSIQFEFDSEFRFSGKKCYEVNQHNILNKKLKFSLQFWFLLAVLFESIWSFLTLNLDSGSKNEFKCISEAFGRKNKISLPIIHAFEHFFFSLLHKFESIMRVWFWILIHQEKCMEIHQRNILKKKLKFLL